MHMESICTRTFLQSHHSILNRIHFICMIWIYIAENGITYSCIPVFAMHPSLVHHHLYIDSLCPIFGTKIDSISLNPFGYRNSILLMYYYVMSRPMSLESSRVALADGVKSSSDCWWCWHTNVKIAEWCLWRKHSFWYLYNETMSAIWHWAKLFICSESIFLIPFTSSLHSLKRERKQCPLPNLSNKSLVWLH